MKSSLFVTLEGGEGTGKSTLLARLIETLTAQGYSVVATREPGGTALGEKIRELVLHQNTDITVCDHAELMLFLAARTQHIHELIEPSLNKGKIVICDRFNDSTVSYQGAARGLGMHKVQQQCELACDGVLPQLTLFLDLDPQIGLERTKRITKDSAGEGSVDRIESEKLQFHHSVRDAMRQLAKENPQRIQTIDASQSLDAVYAEALETILEKINVTAKECDV